MLSNKKGQISIEFLFLLSVLVIGGVVFVVYYIQSIEKNKQEDVSNDVLDDLITDYKKDVNKDFNILNYANNPKITDVYIFDLDYCCIKYIC